MSGLTDQDARALTYLARRLRDETHGCARWDDAGTYAVIKRLVGQNLALSIERVTRHAADPAARTPGAIERPFVPDAKAPSRTRVEWADDAHRCRTCSLPAADCREVWAADHKFEPAIKVVVPGGVKSAVDELRDHKAHAGPHTDPPREPGTKGTERVAAVREALATSNEPTTEETA